MVVQIACWSRRCGDTIGSSGGIVGIRDECVGGRCTNNHFHGTQVGDKGSQRLLFLFSFPKS